jgi:hypothetical protein
MFQIPPLGRYPATTPSVTLDTAYSSETYFIWITTSSLINYMVHMIAIQ